MPYQKYPSGHSISVNKAYYSKKCAICGSQDKERKKILIVQINSWRDDDKWYPICRKCHKLPYKEKMYKLGHPRPNTDTSRFTEQ